MRRESSSSFAVVSAEDDEVFSCSSSARVSARSRSSCRIFSSVESCEGGTGVGVEVGYWAYAAAANPRARETAAANRAIRPMMSYLLSGGVGREAAHACGSAESNEGSKRPGWRPPRDGRREPRERGFPARRPAGGSVSERARPFSGPRTKNAVDRTSATRPVGAMTVTDPKSGAGSPVWGSRRWPMRRPATSRNRSESPEVEAERSARPSSRTVRSRSRGSATGTRHGFSDVSEPTAKTCPPRSSRALRTPAFASDFAARSSP